MSAHLLFTLKDLRVAHSEPHVDRVIHEFLKIGEAVAGRWIQMPKGVLFLQKAPENPASGAIYIYDRQTQELYMLSFDGDDDHLTVEDFSELFTEYNLLRYAEQPGLLHSALQSAGSA
ncbi:MAG TPA: hypothetical protein VK699_01080 [Terriglobales bacterium]|nr:hypothetical protein [Terriglobales bacterium]